MNKHLIHIIFITIGLAYAIGCANPKEHELDVNYSTASASNPDTLIAEKPQIWSNKTDSSYTFGQGNNIILDWTPSNFDTISEEIFLSLKKTFNQSIKKDSSSIIYSDSLFTIQTAKSRISYNHIATPNQWSVYEGFVKPFKLYLITHWHEGSILTGEMKMIDSVSNISYSVISVSDGPTEIPTVSNDNKYLMVHSCNYHYSNITILERIERNATFIELTSFSVKGLIRDIGWTKNNTICFKLDYQNYFDKSTDKIGYYRSKLPIDELKWEKNNL